MASENGNGPVHLPCVWGNVLEVKHKTCSVEHAICIGDVPMCARVHNAVVLTLLCTYASIAPAGEK